VDINLGDTAGSAFIRGSKQGDAFSGSHNTIPFLTQLRHVEEVCTDVAAQRIRGYPPSPSGPLFYLRPEGKMYSTTLRFTALPATLERCDTL